MRAEWYGTFSFLSEIQTPEGPAMVCTTCKRAGLKKGLGAKPSTNFRKSVLADHAKSKEHLQVGLSGTGSFHQTYLSTEASRRASYTLLCAGNSTLQKTGHAGG